jgi:hypothetical protein
LTKKITKYHHWQVCLLSVKISKQVTGGQHFFLNSNIIQQYSVIFNWWSRVQPVKVPYNFRNDCPNELNTFYSAGAAGFLSLNKNNRFIFNIFFLIIKSFANQWQLCTFWNVWIILIIIFFQLTGPIGWGGPQKTC